MISRRVFMKWAGASAIAPFIAAKLGPLPPPCVQYLPIVTRSALSSTQTSLRIALNYAIGDPANHSVILDYYAALGYTHVIVWLQLPETIQGLREQFKKRDGRWVYNGGRYEEGTIASAFRALKTAVETRGMRAIPAVGSLSHVERFIELDSTISEFQWDPAKPFEEQTSFEDYLRANSIEEDRITDAVGKMPLGHVAKVGENLGMDELFTECVRIVKHNWGNTALGGLAPGLWHLGHDELGYAWACCIKADRSRGLEGSKSQLVAAEITQRIDLIHSMFSDTAQVMVYGDSFLPADYGETYGMAGDLQTGEGGVLQILRDKYGVTDRLIVLPWIYSFPDGYFDRWGRQLVFNKVKQIGFLDRLGIRYIPCTGEDEGSLTWADALSAIERTKQTTFEWVRASQLLPRYQAGFAHLGFTGLEHNSAAGVSHDYNACLLAYLAWTYGERSLKLTRHNNYGPRIFSRVLYGPSSQDRKWIEGVHHSRPPLQGSLLMMAGS